MKKSLLFLLLINCFFLKAQSLDQNFNPQDIGFYNDENYSHRSVRKTVIQPDGKILLLGNFTTYQTTYQTTYENKLVRLNSDGTLDNDFNISTADTNIGNVVLQEDGKIIVIGNFLKFNGEDIPYLVRLHTNGMIDRSFTPSGLNGGISCAVVNNGKIIIGGNFTNFNGHTFIARLNSNGSTDETFNSNLFNQGVSVISNYPGNKYIIWSYSTNSFVRLNNDGSLDNTFGNFRFGGYLNDIKITNDNKIYAVGSFSTYNSIKRINIARLNADGSLDTSFNPQNGTDTTITTVSVLKDNSVMIGGFFTKYNSVNRKYIAKIRADGTLDNDFNVTELPNSYIYEAKVLDDNSFIINGDFDLISNSNRKNIAKYNYQFLNTNEDVKSTFSIYPNPFTDRINFSDPLSNIEIHDFSGRKVYSVSTQTNNLNIKNLNKGVYILSGVNKEGIIKSYKIEKK